MDGSSRATIFGSVIAIAAAVAGCTAYFTWRRRGLPPTRKLRHSDRARFRVDRQMVKVVSSCEDWEDVQPKVEADLNVLKALGMDCEWVGTNPVALIQLATHTGLCILIRIQLLASVPDSLKSILNDKGILKLGVAIYDDAHRLHKDHGLCVRGCVDLRYLAVRSTKYEYGNFGLKDLTLGILGQILEKSTHVRCSDWQAKQLTNEQIQYAAGDALVAIDIFTKLVHDKLTPESGPHAERDVRQKALSICQGIVDVKFSLKSSGIKQRMGGGKRPKDLFKPVSRSYTARNKPLYHNCQLWAPDGQLLCTCDVKKAMWYVEKGLGTKVRDDPLTVQLKFEPSGRPLSEATNYYLQDKKNQCVVCGHPDSYTRKNIVPHEYRKHFPAVLKDHKSHDVVLMCLTCHQRSSQLDAEMRSYLESKCDAPTGSSKHHKWLNDQALVKVKSASRALLHGKNIPEARRQQLEMVIKEYYQIEEVSTDVLTEGSKLDTKLLNDGFSCHGEKVVAYMREHEGLFKFEKMWRQHFLDNMAPQYLPPLWSVNHSDERLKSLELGLPSTFQASQSET